MCEHTWTCGTKTARHPQDREAQRVSYSANLACTLWIKTLVLTVSFAAKQVFIWSDSPNYGNFSYCLYVVNLKNLKSKDKTQKFGKPPLINRDKIELSE